MKSMLLSVTILGIVIAGMVLYAEEKRKPKNRVKDAAEDAYDTMNDALGGIERPMQYAMG